jgi:hypothetical protein
LSEDKETKKGWSKKKKALVGIGIFFLAIFVILVSIPAYYIIAVSSLNISPEYDERVKSEARKSVNCKINAEEIPGYNNNINQMFYDKCMGYDIILEDYLNKKELQNYRILSTSCFDQMMQLPTLNKALEEMVYEKCIDNINKQYYSKAENNRNQG